MKTQTQTTKLVSNGIIGLYGEEYDANLRAVVLDLSMHDNEVEMENDSLAELQTVLHPSKVRSVFNVSKEGANYSVMRANAIWHSTPITRDGREVDQYGTVCGNLLCVMSIWDKENGRHAHALRAGDRYGKYVWASKRFIELAIKLKIAA